MRFNVKESWSDFKASVTILITVFAWTFIYSIVGYYLYAYTFEGLMAFGDFTQSYVSLLTLLTTANFPDVMLPAYQKNYFSMIFFVSFLLVGLFFLLSLLLASVFNKFKGRLKERIEKNEQRRQIQVTKAYDMFDTE